MRQKRVDRSFLKQVKKYSSIFAIFFRETIAYPKKLQVSFIIVPFRIGILLVIYSYAFSYLGRSINGINANIAIWSIAVYHILLFAQFRGIFKTINDEIKNGSVELQITRPYNYLFFKFFEHLGRGVPNLLIGAIAVVPFLLYFAGVPQSDFSVFKLLIFTLLIILGTLISGALFILVVLPAFWIDDAMPFYWLVDKGILILGGSYVPVALMPPSMQSLANFSPVGATMFATQVFNPDFYSKWVQLLSVQLFWLIFLFAAVNFVYKKAQLKISINGG